jgi:hypothetical protein
MDDRDVRGGFLSPFTDIDAAFTPPKELLTYDDSGYWNEQKRWRTSNGGKLMAFTVLATCLSGITAQMC